MSFSSAISMLSLLTACAGYTPQDAPSRQAVIQNASVAAVVDQVVPYALVSLTPSVLANTNAATASSLGSLASLRGGVYGDVTIAVGDIVTITIFEAQAGGLFIPREAGSRSGNFVDIPRQQVDQAGNITVPYAGTVKVAGLTTRAVSDIIRERIRNRAIDPQAVVSVVEQRGNQVSVLGEVNAPLRFAIDPGGIRTLGAIARAGGPKYPAYETVVSIKRGGRVIRQIMSEIVRNPRDDTFLAPGDTIFLSREPRVFIVLGSTPSPGSIGGTNNRRFTFENDRMNLVEAIAKAGGLDGARADNTSVYVMRAESRTMLENAGVSTAGIPGRLVPTVYSVDLSKPDGLFLADRFNVRDHDVLLVSESPATEITKFLSPLSPLTSNAASVSTIVVAPR